MSIYGTSRATLRLRIGLHLILYRMHNFAEDRRCPMFHSVTPPVKKRTPLTTRYSSLRLIMIIVLNLKLIIERRVMWDRQPSTTPQKSTQKCQWQNKTSKTSLQERPVIKYSPGLPKMPSVSIQFNKLYSEINITENIKIFLQLLHDHD